MNEYIKIVESFEKKKKPSQKEKLIKKGVIKSEKEYNEYKELIQKANAKSKRIINYYSKNEAFRPENIPQPKFNINREIKSREDFLKTKRAINKVLDRNYLKNKIEGEKQEMIRQLKSYKRMGVLGGVFDRDNVKDLKNMTLNIKKLSVKAFLKMTIKFELNLLVYGSPKAIKAYLELIGETMEQFTNRLKKELSTLGDKNTINKIKNKIDFLNERE